MPIGTFYDRIRGYIKTGVGGFAGGFGTFQTLEKLRSNINDTPDQILSKDKKDNYLSRLDEIYKQALDGNLIGSYRNAKRLVYHLYADIFRHSDYVQERLDDIISRDELFTDLIFAVDVGEFLPLYKEFNERLSKFRIIKWLNGLVSTDLDPVDLGVMFWAGLRSGYLKYYWWNVFDEKGFTYDALREATRGTFRFALHAGIEKALPGEAAPFFFDNVAFDIETKRFRLERPERERERIYAFERPRPMIEEEFMRIDAEAEARDILREVKYGEVLRAA